MDLVDTLKPAGPVEELAKTLNIPYEEGMSVESLYQSILVEAQLNLEKVIKKENKCGRMALVITFDVKKIDLSEKIVSEETTQAEKIEALSQITKNISDDNKCLMELYKQVALKVKSEYINKVSSEEKGLDDEVKKDIRESFLASRALLVELRRVKRLIAESEENFKRATNQIWREQVWEVFVKRQKAISEVIPDFERTLRAKCPGVQKAPILCWEADKALLRKSKDENRKALALISQFNNVNDLDMTKEERENVREVSDEILYLEDDMQLSEVSETLNKVSIKKTNEFAAQYIAFLLKGHEEQVIDGLTLKDIAPVYASVLRQALYLHGYLSRNKISLSEIPEISRHEKDIQKMLAAVPGTKEIRIIEDSFAKDGRVSDWSHINKLVC